MSRLKKRIKKITALSSFYRKAHTFIGLGIGLFVVYLAFTGLFLNHPGFFSDSNQLQHLAVSSGSESLMIGVQGKALVVSDNGGDTFQPIPFRYSTSDIVDISIDQNQYIAIVFQNGLILKSALIRPLIWDRILGPSQAKDLIKIDVDSNGDLYLLAKNGLFRYRDAQWVTLQAFSTHLYDFFKNLHTGYTFAPWLIYVHDFVAILLILLVLSGFVIYLRIIRQ